MVRPKALVAIQGISRNVFGHAVSEIEMVEIILDHERKHSKQDGSVAAHFPLDLEGSELKSLLHTNLQIIVPRENEDLGVEVNYWRGLADMRATCPMASRACLVDHGDVYTSCLIENLLTMECKVCPDKNKTANRFWLQSPVFKQAGGVLPLEETPWEHTRSFNCGEA